MFLSLLLQGQIYLRTTYNLVNLKVGHIFAEIFQIAIYGIQGWELEVDRDRMIY
jgi:hypothetical protein